MAADINFLPTENSQKPEKPQVRKIEYTRPEGDKPKASPTRHGGLFSVFSKREEEPVFDQKKEQIVHEPIVHEPKEKKFVPPKVTMTVEKKKPKDEKKRKSFFAWVRGLFSRTEKPTASKTWQAYQEMAPKPEAYDAKKVEGKFDTHVMQPPPPPASSPREILESLQPPKNVPPSAPVPQVAPTAAPVPPVPPKVVPAPMPTVPLATPKKTIDATVSLPSEQKFTEAKVDSGPQSQGMSFDVNLVPEDLAERNKTFSRISLLGLIIVVSIAFVGLTFGALEVYRQNVTSKIRNLDDELAGVRNQVIPLKQVQLDALALKKRTDEVYKLLDSQVHWTQFFVMLEKYTLKNVTFSSLTADSNGAVTLVATAPSPDVAFEQVSVFKKATDFLEKVEMQQLPTITTTATITETTTPSTTTSGIPVVTPTTPQPGTNTTSSFTVLLTLQPSLLLSTSALGQAN